MGEIAHPRQDSARTKAYFEETVSICHDTGIMLELLYKRSGLIFSATLAPRLAWGGYISYNDAVLLHTSYHTHPCFVNSTADYR